MLGRVLPENMENEKWFAQKKVYAIIYSWHFLNTLSSCALAAAYGRCSLQRKRERSRGEMNVRDHGERDESVNIHWERQSVGNNAGVGG